jgi:hypothetical protein
MTGNRKCEPGCTCKKHSRKRIIAWDDPEQRRAYNVQKKREKYAADPEPAREQARRWRAANPGRNGRLRDRPAEYKWRYGITAADVARMAEDQGGACYLCMEPLDFETPRRVHIDHDKACCRGRRSCGTCIRGLACNKCNAGIGHFGDDADRMRRVADNLEMANRRLRPEGQGMIPGLGSVFGGSDAPPVNEVKE